MKIKNLKKEDIWDYENGFYWFAKNDRLSKFLSRYELYKDAKTVGEFLSLGGSRADLKNDQAKGFVSVDGAPLATPAKEASSRLSGGAARAPGASPAKGPAPGAAGAQPKATPPSVGKASARAKAASPSRLPAAPTPPSASGPQGTQGTAALIAAAATAQAFTEVGVTFSKLASGLHLDVVAVPLGQVRPELLAPPLENCGSMLARCDFFFLKQGVALPPPRILWQVGGCLINSFRAAPGPANAPWVTRGCCPAEAACGPDE